MYDLSGQNRMAKVTPDVYAINPNSTQAINWAAENWELKGEKVA